MKTTLPLCFSRAKRPALSLLAAFCAFALHAQTPAPAATGQGFLDFGAPPKDFAPAAKGTTLEMKALQFLPAPLEEGRIILNQRLRYEGVSQTGVNSSKALTLRTRLGYETPKWYGLYGVGIFENTWAINSGSYAPYPGFTGGKAVIGDPRNNQLNELYLGYAGFNSEFKGGRQSINLDNQRFVGTVDWRQNDQTYDAVRVTTQAFKDVWLSYTWNWQVNRVYGDYAPTSALRRFDANNHLFNLHYTGLPKIGTFGAYVYYLDLDNATAARVTSAGTQKLSSTTYGLFLDGRYAIDADWAAIYRLEYANQSDNKADNPASFSQNYYNVTLGGAYQKFEMGGTFESLGGNGTQAFQTPLATLHKFNGWADQFLTTPATGLRDYFLWQRSPLPLALSLSTELHYFTAVQTAQTFGREADIALSRKFGENVTATIKLARYWGNGAPNTGIRADVTKFWLQLEFNL
ncbi:MAG TPA: alginate export family protein [Opitutales bacterium]|nr:alginate export family protein [Opitutales bacterium]